ncbi:peptidase E [Mangrovimonas sp. AS39]|uniref:DUF6702 family protein n=1 Tax=Mangrovimonas TaxID=1211036 RepID=UPI0006B4C92D|nr:MULTISPECIES: DUF6702 family protein [Mangrovimonas]MCF1190730.1 peptidase E [Mangrovimonas futianensis]MCF1194427.1 peptidase E [Mangrovimonas futianensis]
MKYLLILFVVPLMAFSSLHKYYVSITQVEYVPEKKSLQLISRIFIDDLEDVLQARYDENLVMAYKNEDKQVDLYVEKYIRSKFGIKINGQEVSLNYIGKEYEDDIAIVYLEVENVKKISSIEITNSVLYDLYEEQQNIIRTKINSKNKSFILTRENDKAMLNYD